MSVLLDPVTLEDVAEALGVTPGALRTARVRGDFPVADTEKSTRWKRVRWKGGLVPMESTAPRVLEFCVAVVRMACANGLLGYEEVLRPAEVSLVEQALLVGKVDRAHCARLGARLAEKQEARTRVARELQAMSDAEAAKYENELQARKDEHRARVKAAGHMPWEREKTDVKEGAEEGWVPEQDF